MSLFSLRKSGHFAKDSRGSVSIETLIIVPILFWALVATVVFFDGFRVRTQAQMAAQNVADALSRETNIFTAAYLEGMNDVYDFLVNTRHPTRLRVSSVIWNSAEQRNALQWSYGTRDLAALPDTTFQLLQEQDYEALQALFAAEEGGSFTASAQAPRPDLAERIPPVLPGEALILVEAFTLWSPFMDVGVGRMRFSPVAVTRPRFSPWVNLEGAVVINPETDYEVPSIGYVPGVDSLPDPNEPDPEDDKTGDQVVVTQNFESGGADGWSRQTVSSASGYGKFLGPFGRETYTAPLTFNVDLGQTPAARARIEFDLLVLDSWDGYNTSSAPLEGDHLAILIDGVPVTLEHFNVDRPTFLGTQRRTPVTRNGRRHVTEAELTRSGTNFYGSSWQDQIWRVSVEIEGPPRNFVLGFSARLDEAINNEAFGIDNFQVTAYLGTPPAPAPFPTQVLLGYDPITRFDVHGGCPDPDLPANTVTLRNGDLSTALQMSHRARGQTGLGSCPGLNGYQRYVHASPSFVLDYDSQGQTGTNRRLRIRTDDNNNGLTCNSTLLVRDPQGQWWFNSDIASGILFLFRNYNAQINMGNASSGRYFVWVGSDSGAACNTRVHIERY